MHAPGVRRWGHQLPPMEDSVKPLCFSMNVVADSTRHSPETAAPASLAAGSRGAPIASAQPSPPCPH
eukprot:scaffold141022_cov232-Phaeocystis_antarctica.AAC.1